MSCSPLARLSPKPLLTAAFLAAAATGLAQDVTQVFPNPKDRASKGVKVPNRHHTGDVWLESLAAGTDTFPYAMAAVTMAPGARLNWHQHPEGQRLLFVGGRGYYQERGGPLQLMRPGALVECAPGVSHWHAAAPAEQTVYLAFSGDAPTEWFEPVTDEAYAATPVDYLTHRDSLDVLALSQNKWQWMADKDTARLSQLFDPAARFTHMGGTWGTARELDVIGSGGIHYKRAEVHEAYADVLGDLAIVYNRITLLALVGGNEVTNPFTVTEVYQRGGGDWRLASMAFTKLLER